MVDIAFIRDRLLKEVLSGDYPDETRSVLLYQAGQVLEMGDGENAEALRHYLLSLKLEDDFQLPILAAGSILLGASSYQRLTKLYHMALERAGGRMANLLKLFLAEYVEVAPVEGLDRAGLIGEVLESREDRVLALALDEWERLVHSDREGRITVLDRWKDATAQPLVAAQLRLEIANHLLEDGDPSRVWQLVGEAQEAEVDIFPRFAECLRLGLSTEDRLQAVSMVLTEARQLLAEQQPPAREALRSHFILAEPEDSAQAAAILASFAWLLSAGHQDVFRDETVRDEMNAILGGLEPGVVMRSGLDGVLVEYLIGAGRIDALEEYLAAVGGEGASVDRAWTLWNRARAALAAGRFEDVRGLFGEIRGLGFDSRVLDALESLGGAAPEGEGEQEGGSPDAFNALIDLEARWAAGEDIEPISRLLAGWGDLGGGLADLAFAAARLTGDTFLRQKALEHWRREGGPRSEAALIDLVRLHGFERPSVEALSEVIRGAGETAGAAGMCASLLGLPQLVREGRGGDAQAGLRAVISRAIDVDATDSTVGRHIDFAIGRQGDGESAPPDSFGPLEIHSLLGSVGNPDEVRRSLGWLAGAIESSSAGLEPAIAGAVAASLLSGSLPEGGEADRLSRTLLDPSYGLDAATRLHLTLRMGDRGRVLEVLEELAGGLEPGPARASLRVMIGLRRLFEDGDPDAAIHAIGSAVADDPENTEALFALAFLGPAVDRWEDVAAALDGLIGEDAGDDGLHVSWRRVRMLLSLLLEKDAEGAARRATEILNVRGGDPMSLLVRLAVARSTGDLDGYVRELDRLALWFGDPQVKGFIAHHQVQLGLLDATSESGQEVEDSLPPPDPVNLSPSVATAVLNGPVDLTDAGARAALEEARGLTGTAHKSRMLVELGELVEAAGQGQIALEAFSAALEVDPLEPAAIEGVIRLASRYEEHAPLARGYEARAGYVAGTKARVGFLVKAAEEYAKDKSTAQKAADCYQQAAELDPADPRSFAGLLRAMELRGDIQGVIDIIERRVASTMEPVEIEALQLKLADLRRQIKDYDGALVALDDLLIVQPGKIIAWKMKLDLLLNEGRFEEALDAADQLLERADDRQARVAVLHKCISVSLARLKDLERGLKYCLALVGEGEADENLVNKTMRLALRLKAWDEAAALQEELATKADTQEKKHALLLKKAEIHMRYSKDMKTAGEVYRRILSENPVAWEALVRWNASRGQEGVSYEDVSPYIEQVHGLLEVDPFRTDALNFLVKAYRILRDVTAARFYDTIMGIVAGTAEEGVRTDSRTSMAPMVPPIPKHILPEEDVAELLGLRGPGSFVAGALANLCEGGGLHVLAADGALPDPIDAQPYEAHVPLVRQIRAWGEALGIEQLALEKSDGIEEGIRLSSRQVLVMDSALAHPVPDAVLFRAGVLLAYLAMKAPVMGLVQRDGLLEFIKAGFMASGADLILDPADGTWELAERLRKSVSSGCLSRLASLAEVSPAANVAGLKEGLAQLELGTVRTGVLVSASVPGMLAYDRRIDGLSGDELREFFESDARLKEGLRFALSARFGKLRKYVGLEF